ncbi:hypothetical protein [Demequina rhizosphaerae]|uniref:hypothetical protein n=1 Tax=Demequina rhizosphaerae TaxID=1638985 RepID=UPI000AA8FF0C|nr:hypothetical protein [Demequina rhizosphaerae]
MRSRSTLIFVDTSSLLDSCWNGDERRGIPITFDHLKEQAFWDVELRSLSARGRLVLTARNHEELVKHSNSSRDPELAERARYVLAKLAPLFKSGAVEVVGDQNDPFADAVLLSVALKFRTQANLVFVTQDRALARDLLKVVSFESVHPRGGQTMEVCRVARSGRVEAVRNHERPAQRSDDRTRSSIPTTTESREADRAPAAKAWWQRARSGER